MSQGHHSRVNTRNAALWATLPLCVLTSCVVFHGKPQDDALRGQDAPPTPASEQATATGVPDAALPQPFDPRNCLKDHAGPQGILDLTEHRSLDDPVAAAHRLAAYLKSTPPPSRTEVLALLPEGPAGKRRRDLDDDTCLVLPSGKCSQAPRAIDAQILSRENGGGATPDDVVAIVTLTRDHRPEDLVELLARGVRLYDIIGDRSAIARIPATRVAELGTIRGVQGVRPYRVEDRLPDWLPQTETVDLIIRCLDDSIAAHARKAIAAGVDVVYQSVDQQQMVARIAVSNLVPFVAQSPWIKCVLPMPLDLPCADFTYIDYSPSDSRELVSANSSGYSGAGVLLGIRDTGVYTNHPMLRGKFHADSELDVEDLHGTHVCGIAAGAPATVEGPWGNDTVGGVASNATVLFRRFKLETSLPLVGYPADFDAFSSHGVRVVNQSGGIAFFGIPLFNYSSYVADYDGFVDNYGMVLVNAAGNSGANATTITAPANGKNVLTVGAVRFSTNPDSPALEQIGMVADYSSRGPTYGDGRLKPDVVAPGGGDWGSRDGVVSSCSRSWSYDGVNGTINGVPEGAEWPSDDRYIRLAGTSMAAPHVAGICADILQWSPSISSELIRALVVNAAIPTRNNSNDPQGGYANGSYGYGLANAFFPVMGISGEYQRLLLVDGNLSESDVPLFDDWTFTVASGTKELMATMAYNDDEAIRSLTDFINDDLDVALISPSGHFYFQNRADGVTGQSTVEKICVTNPAPGTWTARVQVFDSPGLNSDLIYFTQRYGLVVDARLVNPSLSIFAPSSIFVAPGHTFWADVTVVNSGGYIAAGVDVDFWNTDGWGFQTVGSRVRQRYFGNLIGRNRSRSEAFHIQVPSLALGDYPLVFRASAINRGVADVTQATTLHITRFSLGDSFCALRSETAGSAVWFGLSGVHPNGFLPPAIVGSSVSITDADIKSTPGYNCGPACDDLRIAYRSYPVGGAAGAWQLTEPLPFGSNVGSWPGWEDLWRWTNDAPILGPFTPGTRVDFYFQGVGDMESWRSGVWEYTNYDKGAGPYYSFDVIAPVRHVNLSGNLNFGNVTTGLSAFGAMTISNTGNSALTILGVSFPSGFAGALPAVVSPGMASNVTVKFSPSAAGPYGGVITIQSDATSGGSTISCSGTGVLPQTRIIGLSGNLHFGNVAVGISTGRAVVITNSGNSVLTLQGASFPPAFTGAPPGTIAPGASASMVVTFSPGSTSAYGGAVAIQSDATGGNGNIACSGSGVVTVASTSRLIVVVRDETGEAKANALVVRTGGEVSVRTNVTVGMGQVQYDDMQVGSDYAFAASYADVDGLEELSELWYTTAYHHAQGNILAADNACDAAYTSIVYHAANGGAGLDAWQVVPPSNEAARGCFIADANLNGSKAGPGINCGGGKAWALYAHDGALAEAKRVFLSGGLADGERFAVKLDTGYHDGSSTSAGFGLQDHTGANRFEFFHRAGDLNYSINDSQINFDTGVPWTDGGLDIVLTVTSSNTYSLRVARNAAGEATFARSFAPGGRVDRVRFFYYSTYPSGGLERDFYFNNLEIRGIEDASLELPREFAYAEAWRLYNASDDVPFDAGQTTTVGALVRLEVDVRSRRSEERSARVRVVLDADMSPPFDFDETDGALLMAGGGGLRTFTFTNSVAGTGTFFLAMNVDDEEAGKTDGVSWQPAFVAVAGTQVDVRALSLSGDLDFGWVPLGASSNRWIHIQNDGNAPVTVQLISAPPGFASSWTGVVAVSSSVTPAVTFAPEQPGLVTGRIALVSDATEGSNGIPCSGMGEVIVSGVAVQSNALSLKVYLPAGSTASIYRADDLMSQNWLFATNVVADATVTNCIVPSGGDGGAFIRFQK